ncbi:MAG TPA: hypothetical protein VM364_04515 [Vicinamibacterales bacterium]|nr:hypothetical protein [Vicinamibacterales bacterium]
MPATGIRLHVAVLLGYVCLATAFSWPLPLHLGTALLGPVSGDLGVYVWNLWVFRHEIVVNGSFPFLTNEILPLTPPVPLTLHNYTTAANIAAFFLQPIAGTVTTFNLLTLLSAVLAAYAMFLMIRRATGDAAAAWVAGIAFGFSPFMNARATEHFSLVQAAPLPLFILLLDRMRSAPTFLAAAATGACVAWAFLSDPYYAVYCVLIAVLKVGCAAFDIRLTRGVAPLRPRIALDLLLVCLGGLIVGVVIRGGGSVELFGLRVSVTRLYNPVLAFSVLLMARVALSLRARIRWVPSLPPARAVLTLGATCALLLAPVLTAMALAYRDSELITPPVLWRSSAPGLDLLSFFVPNPLHPWFGHFFTDGLRQSPGGFVENVAAIPWTVLLLVGAGTVVAWKQIPRFWLVFTALFGLLALGPFVQIAGVLTYVPTPWALLRYVPVIGAARMPPRFAILVALGMAALLGFVLRELRTRTSRPRLLTAAVTAVLVVELLPAPRTLHSAEVPSVYQVIAQDPRRVVVLDLPFGLRDGLRSYGNTSAAWQYYQTVHQKPILGGYLSRLPKRDVERYDQRRVTKTLMWLSEGRPVPPYRLEEAAGRVPDFIRELQIGYVVIDTNRSPQALMDFAKSAFELTPLLADRGFVLYRTSLLDAVPASGGGH